MSEHYSKNCEIEPIIPQPLPKGMEEELFNTFSRLVEISAGHVREQLEKEYKLNAGVRLSEDMLFQFSNTTIIRILERLLEDLKSKSVP